MWKKIICFLVGHNWKEKQIALIKMRVAADVCKRCGELKGPGKGRIAFRRLDYEQA